ncbi:Acylphosphate phosphohydrolase, putative [Marinobacter nitratireducens]|uniref:acylphosphatase n=1 Tax=Marinobacter nitratireducens TaxID=1137280 RepID=A0A072N5I7_9GAMM|nr:acylphosphatase [Marinobacter nitratireducens]KEF32517.1 Acylphosphate phosphohydrolase, putative [Marinobacter nitratireducens]
MGIKRWKLRVSGIVQGVYFRASAEKSATEIGVTGYTRNLPDGDVEIVAEGSEGQLQQLKDWCHQGPPASRVDAVEVIEESATGEFSGFVIRR